MAEDYVPESQVVVMGFWVAVIGGSTEQLAVTVIVKSVFSLQEQPTIHPNPQYPPSNNPADDESPATFKLKAYGLVVSYELSDKTNEPLALIIAPVNEIVSSSLKAAHPFTESAGSPTVYVYEVCQLPFLLMPAMATVATM